MPCYASAAYPGDAASRGQFARWMGSAARAAGLPAELPVMAALVDSGLRNRPARRRERHGRQWIADIERPAEQLRGRYQLRLAEARRLLGLAVP